MEIAVEEPMLFSEGCVLKDCIMRNKFWEYFGGEVPLRIKIHHGIYL